MVFKFNVDCDRKPLERQKRWSTLVGLREIKTKLYSGSVARN